MQKMNYDYGGMSMKKNGGTAGGQALFDALKAKGYKKIGGTAMETGTYKYGGSCGKKMRYNRIKKSF